VRKETAGGNLLARAGLLVQTPAVANLAGSTASTLSHFRGGIVMNDPAILAALIGIAGGLAALWANVRALRTAPRSEKLWGGRAFVLGASVLGLVAWRATFFIAYHQPNFDGHFAYWGWPFPMFAAGRLGRSLVAGPDLIIASILFWFLGPQILVYLYWFHLRTK
jgi:hypothetical protein